jgi:hypothetical protein
MPVDLACLNRIHRGIVSCSRNGLQMHRHHLIAVAEGSTTAMLDVRFELFLFLLEITPLAFD